MENYCKAADLLIYVLAIALSFNVLNLWLYIAICYHKYRDRNVDDIRPITTPYICERTLADDLAQAHSLPSLSGYSTATVRGSISILAMTMATSFTLMSINLYYNAIIFDHGSDAEEWLILISYSALILPGIFPSNNILQNQNGEPIRTWVIFFASTFPLKGSGILHSIGAIMYLFVPTIINLQINWYLDRGITDIYFILCWLSLILNILFGIQQLVIFCLNDLLTLRLPPAALDVPNTHEHYELMNNLWRVNRDNVSTINTIRKVIFFISYTVELLAFPVTTFQYLFIELTLITEFCQNI